MRIVPSKSVALIAALAVIVPLAGCARSGVKRDTSYVARDVDTLYTAAKDRLDRGQYKLAALLFDETERQHPYSVWARRAQLMSAFSYYMAKDFTESTNSAQRFLSIHPGNRVAGKEMEIGRFYERRAQWLAAVIRFRTVVDKYDSTSHTPEALMRLTEAYLALGIPEEAKKAAAVLGANYPGSKWYDRAYQLMQKHPA